MSDSGKSSKLEVSSMLLISMEMAAGRSLRRQDRGDQYESNTLTRCREGASCCTYLMCSQSTDSKNWWLLISSTLTAPIRFSASVQYLGHEHLSAIIWITLCCPLKEKNKSLRTLISSLWPSPRWGPQAGRRGFLSSSSPSCMSPAASQSRREGSLNTAGGHFNSN